MILQKPANPEGRSGASEPEWLATLKDQIDSLRFGTVQVVVPEARVVQIERTEKVRFDRPERDSTNDPGGKADKL